MSTTNIADSICESIEIITQGILEGIKYDQTIECTIIDVSKANQGIYRVSNGSTSFIAYSTEKYSEGASVYVTIPNGDYNNEKLIIGKKVSNENEPFHYTAPFDKLLDISGNLILENDQKTAGLVANRPGMYYEEVYGVTADTYKNYYIYSDEAKEFIYMKNSTTPYDSKEQYYERHTDGMIKKIFDTGELNDGHGYSDFTRLGLRASFQAWLLEYHCIQGNYGIALKVTFKETDIIDNKEELKTYQRVLYLQCEDMIGSPYQFESFYQQEKLFDISQFGAVTRIEGYFFQEKNFYNISGEAIPYLQSDYEDFLGPPAYLLPNLFVEDFYVSIGYDIDEYEGEFVRIFTLDPLTYTTSVDSGDTEQLKALNKKHIELLWYHDTEEEKYKMTEMSGDNFEIRWYRYVLGQPSADEYSGVSWVTEGSKKFDKNITFPDREDGQLAGRDFSIDLQPDITFSQEDIKVIVLYGKAPGFYPYEIVTEEEFIENPSSFWMKNPNYNGIKVVMVTREMFAYTPERYYIKNADGSFTQCNENTIYDPLGVYGIIDDEGYIQCDKDDIWSETGVYFYQEPDTRQVFRSNVLTFTNEVEVPSKATMDAIQALNLTCKDLIDGIMYDSYGNFLIYNELNDLIDKSQANIERLIGCQLKLEDANQNLGNANSITWKFPITNTMIIPKASYEKSYAKVLGLTKEIFESDETDRTIYWIYDEDTDTYTQCAADAIFNPDIGYYIIDGYFAIQKYTQAEIKEQIAYYGMPVFSYYINKRFDLSRTNNYVSCTMDFNGINYSAAKELTFGQAGTMGSDCTFVLDFDNNVTAISLAKDENGEYEENNYGITARMYDINNKEVNLTDSEAGYSIEWGWFRCPAMNRGEATEGSTYTSDNIKIESGDFINKIYLNINNSLKINELYILQATIKGFGDYDLIAYLPIPITIDRKKYLYITGADRIIYLPDGEPQYYKDYYIMHKVIEGTETEFGGTTKALFKEWKTIKQIDHSESGTNAPANESYWPDIVENTKNTGHYQLKPALIFFEGIESTFGAQFIEDGEVKWTQPILIILNRYFSSMINKWDGKTLQMNEEEGTINATAISAGRKNNDGTFSGVCIGDWDGKWIMDSTGRYTGVYGFDEGELCYGFMDNGTAFLGKSSKAQILFDGNRSTITSTSYENNQGGILIDLDDSKMYLVTPGSTLIKNEDGSITLPNSTYGVYLDGQAGYNKETNTLNLDAYPLRIGNNFKVSWNGNLSAYDAYLNDIEAHNATLYDVVCHNLEAYNGYFEGDISGSRVIGSSVYGSFIYGSAFFGGDYTLYLIENSQESNVSGTGIKEEYIPTTVYSEDQKGNYYIQRVDYNTYMKIGITSQESMDSWYELAYSNPNIYGYVCYRVISGTVGSTFKGSFDVYSVPEKWGDPLNIECPEGKDEPGFRYPWNSNEKDYYGSFGYVKGATVDTNTGIQTTNNLGIISKGEHSIIFESSNNARIQADNGLYLVSGKKQIMIKEPGDSDPHPIYAYFA